jgi:PAS domain S-box-containing protein
MTTATVNYDEQVLNDLADYFYGAPIALNMTGPDGAIRRTNLAELKLLGYEADEYVGRHLAEFYSDPDAVQQLFDRLVAGEKVVEHETTLVRRDGSTQKVLLYANAKFEDGRFRGVRCFTFPHPDDLRPDIAEVGALRDLSLQSRGVELSDDERAELFSELFDFFENGPVNLHIVGGDGLIRHANKSELAAMGYDSDAYIGQHIAQFHAEQKVIDGMLEDLVGGTPLINFSATLHHKDGRKVPVMIYSNSRMRDGAFLNTRCFTVAVPKMRPAVAQSESFAWPRNEDFGFTIPGREAPPPPPANPMTLALKYIASRKRPEESLGFLARVSEVFGSDRAFPTMIGEVAGLSVPFLADFASIDLGSLLGHAAVTSLQPRSNDLLNFLRVPGARFGVDAVWNGETNVATDLHAIDDDRARELIALGIRSLIAVPLSMRGMRIGVLTLLREDVPVRRNFGPADRALADELARRIAFAVEIASLTPSA